MSALGLLSGMVIALTLGNPFAKQTKALTPKFLTWSIIGLGAGMNLQTVARAGVSGLGYTLISIALVLFVGFLLMKVFKVERDAGILVTIGTAICGGSAIAAISPVIKARASSISIALGCVFLLNAIALFIFPPIGHYFHLTQTQFGLWSALAIHDTSSVVGATLSYGSEAAQIGTTVKLARALWIVPLTVAAAFLFKSEGQKTKKPWFILGFILVAALVTYVPDLQAPGRIVEQIARYAMVATLFLIGLNLSRETLKQVGWRPLLAGFTLWLITGVTALVAILNGWIS